MARLLNSSAGGRISDLYEFHTRIIHNRIWSTSLKKNSSQNTDLKLNPLTLTSADDDYSAVDEQVPARARNASEKEAVKDDADEGESGDIEDEWDLKRKYF